MNPDNRDAESSGRNPEDMPEDMPEVFPEEIPEVIPEVTDPGDDRGGTAGPLSQHAVKTEIVKERLRSLDAYRGLIMISLAFAGFGLAKTAALQLELDPDSSLWSAVKYQFSHVEWVGCGYWDMIQPSFMFMVGVSMAYSYLGRKRKGQSWLRMLVHALWRSVVLVFLGIFLISFSRGVINWSMTNVLTQIGLGYTFLFLLWGRTVRFQAIVAAAVLLSTWLLYVLYPGSGIDLETGARDLGVTASWAQEHLEDVRSSWHKNGNAGQAIDMWFLNLLPREQPFVSNRGGYLTINFVPSFVTMLFGLMCGELLRSSRSAGRKLVTLLVAGGCGLLAGWLLNWTGVCPLVKRIWTPSWTLFSTGWCCLILMLLHGVIDVLRFRWWAFPLVVVGMNSIAMYCMEMLLKPSTVKALKLCLGKEVFLFWGRLEEAAAVAYHPTVQATMVGLVFWFVCFWMYRKKIFLRI